ncbi:MAG TPA: hypothetical protein VGM54_00055 [Chthoniobacter sp.]
MSFRLEVRSQVGVDIADAAGWYESREAGLGVEFARAVRDSIEVVRRDPCSSECAIGHGKSAGFFWTAFRIALFFEFASMLWSFTPLSMRCVMTAIGNVALSDAVRVDGRDRGQVF